MAAARRARGAGQSISAVRYLLDWPWLVDEIRPLSVVVVARTRSECSVDDHRWQWTTYSNLSTWFDGFKAFLLHHEFAEDKPEKQPDGRTAEVTIPPQKKRRILNADETHHTLDNEGDSGGSRARTYVGRGRRRSRQRHIKATGHVTGL